jgi:hypothetical protein
MGKVWLFLKNPVGSWLRVFVSVVLGLWLADLTDTKVVHWDLSEWMAWLAAGLIAVLPIIIAWVNPLDPRFGRQITTTTSDDTE